MVGKEQRQQIDVDAGTGSIGLPGFLCCAPPLADCRTVRVRVDPDRCEGHGRCYGLAPELFEPDDIGNGHELGDGTVPAGLERQARLAVDNCPERAITIEDDA